MAKKPELAVAAVTGPTNIARAVPLLIKDAEGDIELTSDLNLVSGGDMTIAQALRVIRVVMEDAKRNGLMVQSIAAQRDAALNELAAQRVQLQMSQQPGA